MKIERLKPTVLRITLHSYELAALISAVRWVIHGAKGELPEGAITQLKKILDNYDIETRKVAEKN
jgi:hypothetical protein